MGEGLRLVAEHVCGRAGHGGARAQTSGPSQDVTLASSVVGLRTFRTAQLLRETARAASAGIGMWTLASTLFFAAYKEVHQVCAFGFVYRSRGDISAYSRLLGLGALWKTCKLPRIDAWAVASSTRENRGVLMDMVQPD